MTPDLPLFPARVPPPAPGWEGLRVLSIGHSTLPLERFMALLKAHGVATLVDVRSHPGSRRFPWFGQGSLSESLRAAGIAYAHLPSLGGRRRASDLPPGLNGAWRNDSFHAYADHMQTEDFRAGLHALRDLARVAGPVAVLCAEALPWRCHRFLLSDALFAHGVVVGHVTSPSAPSDHVPPEFAVFRDGSVTYPSAA
jgi:uncharacterized protein (DUF488 family)